MLAACGFAGLTCISAAQNPDVQVKIDVLPTVLQESKERSKLNWYDSLGHYSTVALALGLEPGFRAYVSERLQRIPNNPDTEQLDEYYLEDPGIWRLGKQYLPFGRQGILRESARAARGDTRLLFESVPISLAVCDNGSGQTRGVVGRVGSLIGVSFAIGDNFGAQSTSLTLVRHPEDSPGNGHGFKDVFGLDFARHYKIYTLQAEAAMFRRGETQTDTDTEVSDLALTVAPNRYQSLTLGWSREWRRQADFYRAQAKIFVTRAVWFEPTVRLRNGQFFDLGLALEVKL